MNKQDIIDCEKVVAIGLICISYHLYVIFTLVAHNLL